MKKIREVLRLHHELNFTQGEIAQSVKIAQSTVSEYLTRTKKLGLAWPLPEHLDDIALETMCFPFASRPAGKNQFEPDFLHIHNELKRKGVTLQLLWQEYTIACPQGLRYSRFCDLYRDWAKAHKIWMPQQHKAGEKIFVDYAGMTVPIMNTDGTSFEAQIFVASMGASNYTYIEATQSQQLHDWIGSHVRMLTFFGGCARCLVPDNLKSGVQLSHRYEPELNQTYLDMARHFGVAIVPARVRAPKDKSKVENAVQNVERQILAKLRNRRFFSLEELNEELSKLLTELNCRPFQELPGSRLSTFEETDKPQLLPLPITPYAFALWKKGTIGHNYHINVLDHYYSVHYKYIKQKIDVRITSDTIEIFYKSKRIASHIRSFDKGKYTTNPDHYPPGHKFYANCTPDNLLSEAKKVGENAENWVKTVLNDPAVYGMQKEKVCMGVLRLSKSYGNNRLDTACRRGAHLGIFSCKSIESMLKNNLEQQPLQEPEEEFVLLQDHEYIRGPNYYT